MNLLWIFPAGITAFLLCSCGNQGLTSEYVQEVPVVVIAETTMTETTETSAVTVSTEQTTSTSTETTVITTTTTTTTTETTTSTSLSETTSTVLETTETTETTTETIPEPEVVEFSYDDEYYYFPEFTLTVQDYILLSNCVAHEAGICSPYEKSLVVETVMNRVYSPYFPDTIYDVITQAGQFSGSSGYADLDGYSYEATVSCCEAVENYFCFPQYYQDGYLFFYGDGYRNYFS